MYSNVRSLCETIPGTGHIVSWPCIGLLGIRHVQNILSLTDLFTRLPSGTRLRCDGNLSMRPCVREFNRCCLIAEQSKLQTTGSNPCTSSVAQAIENKPQSFALGWDFILMTSNVKVFLDGLRN